MGRFSDGLKGVLCVVAWPKGHACGGGGAAGAQRRLGPCSWLNVSANQRELSDTPTCSSAIT